MQPGATADGRQGMPADRRRVALSVARTALVSLGLLVGYFVLPMTRLEADSVLSLTLGVAALVALIVWQIREITRSDFPRVRAVEMLATSLSAFLVVFSTAYYVMGHTDPGDFNERLTKLDAAYFTITIFATVGFGDIHAVSQAARAVTTVQMLGDLLVVGVVARMVVNAVRVGVERKEARS